jgi:molybdopterin synthase catalytic subunit
MPVRIQRDDFDTAAEMAALRAGRNDVGAVASFVGICRNHNDGSGVAAMELEHYPGMTERAIEQMIDEARRRWRLLDALVVHRIGPLAPGEQIVLVVVASAHRKDAFAACEFLMDYLKTQAPFWKKETLADGSSRWVEARTSDDDALRRWGVLSRNAA